MKRRDFIKNTALSAVVMPQLFKGFGVNAWANSPILEALSLENDGILVLVRLEGGNDGLNTVIPLDQYEPLSIARKNILIPEKKVLRLRGFDKTGLHPSMTGMQQLFNDGKLGIIQNVGMTTPIFSHFRATDVWMSGSAPDTVLTSGWMGRYLQNQNPEFPKTYATAPLAIEIGGNASLTFQGAKANMAMSVTNPTDFYNLLNNTRPTLPDSKMGNKLAHLRLIHDQTRRYTETVKAAAEKVKNQAPYPTDNELAEQLKIVARLIAGGLPTRIYMVNLSGFDTHDYQVEYNDHTTGKHAELLKRVSDSIAAFVKDLAFLKIEKRVTGLTFSEFGRRITDNASMGTDHGAAAPMFVFGANVKNGILGKNPMIPEKATIEDNVGMQHDFRAVYASVLRGSLGAKASDLPIVLQENLPILPIFK